MASESNSKPDSNAARFHLSVESGASLAVVDFRILEGICGHDWCEARVVGAPGLELENLSASLKFEGAYFHGTIVSQGAQVVEGQTVYTLRLETLLHQLQGEAGFESFDETPYSRIVKSLCELARVNASGASGLLARYNETALEFLRRVEGEASLFDFVRHSESRAELIVSEDDSCFESVDFDPEGASGALVSKSQFSARTHCSQMRPGNAFEAQGKEFVVASVAHYGSIEGGYANHFAALSRGLRPKIPRVPSPALADLCVSREQGALVLRTQGDLRLESQGQMALQGGRVKIVGDLIELN
jgi:hypothetical protein